MGRMRDTRKDIEIKEIEDKQVMINRKNTCKLVNGNDKSDQQSQFRCHCSVLGGPYNSSNVEIKEDSM